ncbi:MAG: hypothetical protein K2X82_10085 [Gemmataceae bacterium]|nr:hypothetical protein [Gemmataceae bacterium]
MRTGLLAALAVLVAPAAAPAADPPVVFQTQPIGRLLEDTRALTKLLGGDQAVKELDAGVKRALGEKGFDGLDLSRPAGGYVLLPADPKGAVGVLALPVTGEEGFAGLCERWNKGKPKALGDGVYEVPSLDPAVAALARVTDGYAYIATAAKGVDLARAVGPDLVPFGKLYDPAEPAWVAGRVYFDRLPPGLREKATAGLEEAKKAVAGAQLPPEVADAARGAFDQFVKLSNRYLDLSKGAKEAVARLNLDPAAGQASAELTLSAVPGSPLALAIAARKPTTNAFAGLLTPDVVTGFRTRLPLFNEELKASAVIGLEALKKQAANIPVPQARPFLEELADGAIRTAKAGDADVAGVMRGPNKDGAYTAVGAAVFADPSGVEKALKKLIQAEAPADFNDLIKWDAEKVGDVSIHVFDLHRWNEEPAREMRKLFGDECVVAVAFAPTMVVGAAGPDAVAAVKGVLALKPAEAPVLDVVVNPAKVARMIGAVDEREAGDAARVLGQEDKPVSAASLAVTGGAELKVTLGLNLKLFAGSWLGARSGAAFEPVEPGLKK